MSRFSSSLFGFLRHLWLSQTAKKTPLHIHEADFPNGKYDPRFDFIRLNISQVDRGAALLLVAVLEQEITDFVRAVFVDDKKLLNDLFKETGALGALATKIRLGYLMGLYSKDTYGDLVSIYRIRNEFAHNHLAWDFEYQRVKDLTNKLGILERARGSKDQLVLAVIRQVDAIFEGKDMSKTYFHFMATVTFLVSLFSVIQQIRRIRPHAPLL